MLSVRNLRVYRGDMEIIKGINIEFEDSTIHVILGINGSGKSTLAGGIMGIYPSTGKIELDGRRIDHMGITERAKLGITLCFQEPARFEGIIIKDYLLISSKEKSLNSLFFTLNLVGLPIEILKKRMDDTLSGGERKRIELASVLLMKPRVAILDEPDSGIDMLSYGKIEEAVYTLKKNGATVILITHNKELVNLGDMAHVLSNGKIIKSGDPKLVKRFFENMNRGDENECS